MLLETVENVCLPNFCVYDSMCFKFSICVHIITIYVYVAAES